MNVEHPPAMHHKRYQDILPRPKALRAGRTSNIERRIMISLRYLAPERKAYSGAVLSFDELVKSPKNVMPDPVSGTGQARSGIRPVYNLVDTCAAEFKASTPYYYSTYETESEARVSAKKKVIILGGGSNRIGQGG